MCPCYLFEILLGSLTVFVFRFGCSLIIADFINLFLSMWFINKFPKIKSIQKNYVLRRVTAHLSPAHSLPPLHPLKGVISLVFDLPFLSFFSPQISSSKNIFLLPLLSHKRGNIDTVLCFAVFASHLLKTTSYQFIEIFLATFYSCVVLHGMGVP